MHTRLDRALGFRALGHSGLVAGAGIDGRSNWRQMKAGLEKAIGKV